MAPAKGSLGGKTDLDEIGNSLRSGSQKERAAGLQDLLYYFNRLDRQPQSLKPLNDKAYHGIFEALFRATLSEKENYFSSRKATRSTASTKLGNCAEGLRVAVTHGAFNIKRKTVCAVIDHITQTLPGPDYDFVEPLFQDYSKALAALLANPANVEGISAMDGEGWFACVDLSTNAIARYFGHGDGDADLPARGSPVPGSAPTFSLTFSGKSGVASTQRSAAQAQGGRLEDILQCLLSLASCPNAPLRSRSGEISQAALQVLEARQFPLKGRHQLALAVLNSIILETQADDLSLISSIVEGVVPLLSHWWHPRTAKRDAMMVSIRDEILKTLHALHLHIDAQIRSTRGSLIGEVEDLMDALWSEYSKRDEKSLLQMSDLTFASNHALANQFNTGLFSLQPNKPTIERDWALIETIATFEAMILNSSRLYSAELDSAELQPRKRRRTTARSNRVQRNLRSTEAGVRLTALQVLSFLSARISMSVDDISETLDVLQAQLSDKRTAISSWAMIACASLTLQSSAQDESIKGTWKQIWQVGVRSASLGGTSRAGCLLLHAVLQRNILSYYTIADDVNNIITSADTSGPALLADSSLVLMLHLFHLRNIALPSASQATSNHAVRWALLKWIPIESTQAATQSMFAVPFDLVKLLSVCCGTTLVGAGRPPRLIGSSIGQCWKNNKQFDNIINYLLLLDNPVLEETFHIDCAECAGSQTSQASDIAGFHASKRLVLELLLPKIKEVVQLSESWAKRSVEAPLLSPERLQSVLSCCVVGALMAPQLGDVHSQSSQELEAAILGLLDNVLKATLESDRNKELVEALLSLIGLYLPSITMSDFEKWSKKNVFLLEIFETLSKNLDKWSSWQSSGQNQDIMDLDEDFDSQASRKGPEARDSGLPRQGIAMTLNTEAFYVETAMRLHLLGLVRENDAHIGFIPESFIDRLVRLSNQEFLACQVLLQDAFGSGLTIQPDDALRVIEKIGGIIGETSFSCCEVAWEMCISIMEAFARIWQTDLKHPIASMVGDLYTYLVKQSLPKKSLSSRAQIGLSRFLFRLLEVNPSYGSSLGLPSCRSSLLSILQTATIPVKFFIGTRLEKIFGLYVLKTHEDIFLDILEVLPTDPEAIEGIAFRLFALAELPCKWPTLLRRSVYHIFETPGKIVRSAKYATRCLAKVSKARSLRSPTELFRLFQPQLLYTWLENDSIDEIPFEIFGFIDIHELLQQAQGEAAAFMIMRDQEGELTSLATKLDTTPPSLVTRNFSKVMSYSIAQDISLASGQQTTAEGRIRRLLGKDQFLDSVYINFADIVGTLLDLIDQEDPIEKSFERVEAIQYAGSVMAEIKELGHSAVSLPPNQQPMFKAKYLVREISHLCTRTQYEMHAMWTPALTVSVARKLLNTIHPALGSLHACSVIRKVRVLICLAGPQATASYPLEMLLHSLREFIQDQECADDVFGISQYLIINGSSHLTHAPSFLAGYALSTLASLRLFMESSQSSTTQESQFQATMSKAQSFHSWFSKFLEGYDSPSFQRNSQGEAFRSITQSAINIRASGNADKGTHESNLLLEILKDGERETQFLNEPSRNLALTMLCGDFKGVPPSHMDIIGSDQEGLSHGAMVWKSCQTQALSQDYLSWAGRVVGRGFAASGQLYEELVQESRLAEYRKLTSSKGGSEEGLLSLLKKFAVSRDFRTAGLAECALRKIVSHAVAEQDASLLMACQTSLSEPLMASSDWSPYAVPPADPLYETLDPVTESQSLGIDGLEKDTWSRDLAIYLARSVPRNIVLGVLPPLLTHIMGFADQAFPFIVHLALSEQLGENQAIRRSLSDALKLWLKSAVPSSKENLRLLINAILYLRTQALPNESSIADRSQWLDVDLVSAATAATRCGMFKVALLFAELAASETTTRSSRRSSATRELDIPDHNDILLEIFENIDDPDAYYGLSQASNLSNILARVEYENDGAKALAFRGAQYDSHLRSRNLSAQKDTLSLVKALGALGLAGLSQALLQTQQSRDSSAPSLDSTFTTARKLEIWNLPAPTGRSSPSITTYKVYQSIYQANDFEAARSTVYEGLATTIKRLTRDGLNSSSLRHNLGTLAMLTELDEILNMSSASEVEAIVRGFEDRSRWMMSGRYVDVSHILSCRETSLSVLGQKDNLRKSSKITEAEARLLVIRSMLLSSNIYRLHHANQESLNLATSLTDLIDSSSEMGLTVGASIKIETANSLWDHGEMIPSIRLLQSIDSESSLDNQSVAVSRSDLLTKIGYQVSVARLESPDSIQKKYLEPALKALKGKQEGKEAAQVFHQFAMFCDEQLQNPDGLEDLARLQNLKKGKSEEVTQLVGLINNAKDTQAKNRYNHHLTKARQWLALDQQELKRVEHTRSEFVKLSLENYLLSLIASDEHNNDALRFTALWLERSEQDYANEAVKRWLSQVPSRKLAPLMNQLSSRLQDDKESAFQALLIRLVFRICCEHPYHGMYQIWAGTRTRTNKNDEVAVSRLRATQRVASQLKNSAQVGGIWAAIDRTSKHYDVLAGERDADKYKAGHRIAIKESSAAQNLMQCLLRYHIPPPTMHIELAVNLDYASVPTIVKLEPGMSIASGVSAPKIITAVGSDGQRYKQLVKGGNDDLRQDAIMEQVFAAVSSLLKQHRTTRQRNLGIRTYKVLPLTSSSGIIEFVPNTIPLHEYLMPAHERYFPKDMKGSQCRKEISAVQSKTVDTRLSAYRKVTDRFHPVMRYFFMEYFVDPDEWYTKRLAYARSTAAISMLGHVLGVGDRHGHNILLDTKTGEAVHIDLGVAFEMGRVLPVPELVPFRLTRDIVDGMGITKTEGVFRRCCEFTLEAMREDTYSIMTVLDVLRYDPLYSWSMSPVRMAKLQDAGRVAEGETGDDKSEVENKRVTNEPSEADRALEVVRKKLSKTLSVTATVNDLINQATDERNLAVLYSGWAAYA